MRPRANGAALAGLALAALLGANAAPLGGPAVAAAQSGRAGEAIASEPDTTRPSGEIPLRPGFVVRDGEPLSLDTHPPHPGEVVGLVLEWPQGERKPLELVGPGADLGGAAPLRFVPGDPRAEGADVLEVLVLALGETEIPAIPLRSIGDGRTVMTTPIKIHVESSLAGSDTAPAPARGQAGLGLEPWGVALWAALALALVTAAFFLLRRRGRPAPEAVVPAEPEVAPEAWAYGALDELLSLGLLDAGRMKEFHIRLAEISKEYLSRRFHVPLRERTTEECPAELRAAGVDRALSLEVGHWLSEIDLVKFAGERPPAEQAMSSVRALKQMIERTTPKPTPEAAAVPGHPGESRAAEAGA